MNRLLALVAALSLAPLPAAAAGRVLPYTQVIQEHDQWCWAGVDRSLLLYYGKDVAQCTLAEYTRTHEPFSDRDFGTVPCCTDWTEGCNDWNYMFGGAGSLEDLLRVFGAMTTSTFYTSLSLAQAQAELDQGRPFVFRWGWDAGGGHFLVGHGYDRQTCSAGKCPNGTTTCSRDEDCSTLSYMNPWYGEGLKIANYAWIQRRSGIHSWTHTVTAVGQGPCTGKADGTACDDGSACTVGDHCTGGVCVPGTALTCTLGPCHSSARCEPATGCVYVQKPEGASCNDGDACTSADQCRAGKCAGTALVCTPSACQTSGRCEPATGKCAYVNKANGAGCDDADPCTLADQCASGVCRGQARECPLGTCHASGTCQKTSGQCAYRLKIDGSGCDDLVASTHDDRCFAGICRGIPEGADPCTGRPDGFACDDGSACTSGDSCAGERCNGVGTTCEAPGECQEDGVCQPATGSCTFAPKPDGTACSTGACRDGVCAKPAGLDAGSAGLDAGGMEPQAEAMGCGCGTGASGAAPWLAVLLLALRRR